MYYINKIVGWVLSPLGVLFLGLFMGCILNAVGKRCQGNTRRCLLALPVWFTRVILVLVWVMSCGITTRFIGAPLEREWAVAGKPHGDITELSDADAIVVLGGGMGRHPKCGAPEMFSAADRVWQSARLYKAGLAKKIVISGPDVEKSTVPLLVDLGVPGEAFLCFSNARNTEEEAKLIYAELNKECNGHKPSILLVTSAWHMRRAKLLFERVGFEVVSAPTDFEMSCYLETSICVMDFLPSCDALLRNSYCIKEWIGYVGYRLLRH